MDYVQLTEKKEEQKWNNKEWNFVYDRGIFHKCKILLPGLYWACEWFANIIKISQKKLHSEVTLD